MSENKQCQVIGKFLQGDPSDLIEVFFEDLNAESWRKLFRWLEGRVMVLDCQLGRLKADELNVDFFLEGSMSYIASIQGIRNFELSLTIIEEAELSIDIKIEDISEENHFLCFLENITHIAEVIDCKKFIVCQEFHRDTPFLVNGK